MPLLAVLAVLMCLLKYVCICVFASALVVYGAITLMVL